MDKTEPAFPQGMPEHGSMPGLSKREIFAAMAMQGMLASSHLVPGEVVGPHIGKLATQHADQLILELAK